MKRRIWYYFLPLVFALVQVQAVFAQTVNPPPPPGGGGGGGGNPDGPLDPLIPFDSTLNLLFLLVAAGFALHVLLRQRGNRKLQTRL
jgi:hypothetical protein